MQILHQPGAAPEFRPGDNGVSFLKSRFDVLHKHHAFSDMEYTEDKAKMAEWMPLMMLAARRTKSSPRPA